VDGDLVQHVHDGPLAVQLQGVEFGRYILHPDHAVEYMRPVGVEYLSLNVGQLFCK
jgi:hypothetical protein